MQTLLQTLFLTLTNVDCEDEDSASKQGSLTENLYHMDVCPGMWVLRTKMVKK